MSDGVRVALFFAALFSASAINTAFLPLWFADRGLSAVAIGQVLGAAALLRVIAGPSWGTAADRIGAPAGHAGGLRHRHRGGAALRPVARVPAAAGGRRGAGRRCVGAQPADRFAGARPRAGRTHGIRQGALDRLDRLHGGERGPGLAAVRRRLLACALAAGRELRRWRGRDAAAAGDRRPDGRAPLAWRGCICSPSARSA